MSRIANAKRNIRYGYINTLVSLFLKFLTRTVFIYTIGVTYLGVNGLFTNILSVLSLADLGISTALNFSLYKPVAQKDIQKIKALMQIFRKAYSIIAIVIAILGLSLLPFLSIFIKNPIGITHSELVLYYLLFLFNTVSTYFVSYKYSLANADQRNYIETNFQTATILVTSLVQVAVLLIFKSFLFYLLSATVIELFHKILVNIYLNKRYPYLSEQVERNLTKEELIPIKRNIKALVFHKIGSVAVHQTDNILISTFIDVSTVGIVSNYVLVMHSITSFINIAFNALVSGLGNLVATEDLERQYTIFKVYRFVGFWLYGFFSISFALLLSPFIHIWLGKEMVLASGVIYVILIDYYIKGHRIVVNNFKTAAGVFDQDKYISLLQAIVNVVVSIVLVLRIGLIGIYIGTVVQGLIFTFSRPAILYKHVFKKKAYLYYKDSLFYVVVLAIPLVALFWIQKQFFSTISILNFLLFGMIDVVVVNGAFLFLLHKREEFSYLKNLFIKKLGRKSHV